MAVLSLPVHRLQVFFDGQRWRRLAKETHWVSWGLALFWAGFIFAWSTRVHRDSLYFLVFLPFLMVLGRQQFQWLLSSRVIQCLGLFLGYLLLSVSWSPDASWALFGSKLRYGLIIFAAVLATAYMVARDEQWAERLFWFLGLAACIVFFYSVYHYYQAHPFPAARLSNLVYYHTNPNPDAVGFLLAFTFALCFVLSDRSPRWRVVAAVPLMCAGAFLLLAQSRGLILGAALVSVFLLLRLRYWKTLALFLVVASAALVAVETVEWGGRGLIERADAQRIGIWQVALARIAEAPWFGAGLASDTSITYGDRIHISPHNLWLMTLMAGGVLGGALLVALYGLALRIAYWDRDDRSPGAILAVALLVAGLVPLGVDGHQIITRIHPHIWVALWLPMGALAGRELLQRQRGQTEGPGARVSRSRSG
ncbi:O-antigen ligase family protein [Alkalilimnicola ehrlichii MLHE-1]|uniref:O-antigen polymerase n=1 Tax=Alkalilimnicola ehrlichii (strain ATCC BAA-1101 / DSM 17681 / MLHE-1) TaxID=187272 RepID=Q0A4U7_ALKEH|nr:O-antigen ligase family protein [Alkalilimnicola ehrlichii]ABI58140.1 O-antigen polymerase [Alkalilimnicola ehrlichii MLHE-1]